MRPLKKGANLVGDLQFTVDEPEKATEAAREEAIEKAKTKANQVAGLTGLKLVKLLNIYENYYRAYESYKDTAAGMGGEIAAAPTIQPGETEITVTVTIVYRVR